MKILRLQIAELQREIARLRRIETELQASEAHAKAVLDTAVDGIITIDHRGLIQSFNRAAERIFGYAADEVIGRNVSLLMPSPDRDRHDGYIQSYLASGERKIIGIGREVTGLRKDGSTFPLELAVSEIKVAGQHHFTGIVRDVSERKRTEEQLRQREQEARQHRERLAHLDRVSTLGEMASGIAHEINQPLTAIATYAQASQRLLSAGQADITAVLATLAKIDAQAQRAGEVIRRLRGFVKRRESKHELCDLNALVRDTVALAETDARAKGLRIETRLAHVALPVMADPIQIQQVILNLIRNGIDAMNDVPPADAALSVTVLAAPEPADGRPAAPVRAAPMQAAPMQAAPMQAAPDHLEAAQVAVRDRGVGLSEECAQHLFEPFFTTKPTGLGLGLSISRSIVASHGGRLWFSRNPDRGTTFLFTLPLAVSA